jgi:hypothetical protein
MNHGQARGEPPFFNSLLGVKRRGELIFILRGIRHNKYIQSG